LDLVVKWDSQELVLWVLKVNEVQLVLKELLVFKDYLVKLEKWGLQVFRE